jgi:CHAD domain-containing protein
MPEDVLRQPAARGARTIALGYLEAAASAHERLVAGTDPEALHDFRVALRRLRSWIRAFRDELGGAVTAKDRRALRAIAASTSPGRDLEVQLAWLTRAEAGRGRDRAAGARWMADALRASTDAAAAAEGVRAAVADFSALHQRLSSRLGHRPHSSGMPLGRLIAIKLREHAGSLGDALDAVSSAHEAEPAHEARIQAKRLRYLLEPAVDQVPEARMLLRSLKSLQDSLGTLHDAHVMRDAIIQRLESDATATVRRRAHRALGVADSATGTAAAPRTALVALLRGVRQDITQSYRPVVARWVKGRRAAFEARTAAVADRLDATYGGKGAS